MVSDDMLTRRRYREVPPRVEYSLTEQARELMPILGELARWGYEWAWSSPRDSESVDLGAIFRLAPGLVQPAGAHGTVELTVKPDSHGDSDSYTVTISDDEVTVQEDAVRSADARVRGNRSAWISAFSPDNDRGGLEITGDSDLAGKLLGGLVAAGQRASDHARAAA